MILTFNIKLIILTKNLLIMSINMTDNENYKEVNPEDTLKELLQKNYLNIFFLS